MSDKRIIVLQVARGDNDAKDTCADVVFCESAASLTIGALTIHIPWTELAQWQMWLAQRAEDL